MIERRKTGLIRQTALLFAVGIIITGIFTFCSQRYLSETAVKRQTEVLAGAVADEVSLSVREYAAYRWLLRYWCSHSDTMEIEYDAEYVPGTETERKSRILTARHPGLMLKYASEAEIEALPERDQKLYAEIVYSWLITRVNQIKRTYQIDYLFCVLTDESFQTQFFVFSAADKGSVRGTNYLEVYPLGTVVTVGESQQEAMRSARQNSSHLAEAGAYEDYYSLFEDMDGGTVLIGMTYNLSELIQDIRSQTLRGSAFAAACQFVLSFICLGLVSFFVLRPLKKVERSIRLYKKTKDSSIVEKHLSSIRMKNEIGQLSTDVIGLSKEIDEYLGRIETITAEKERIGTELSLAMRIQAAMLPSVFPAFPSRPELDIYAVMDPAKEVGGDFYDFFFIDEDHLCLVIADVSGKGIPAALFMMAAKIILANYAKMGVDPAGILRETNRAICANNREEMFVTVWLGILTISTGKLTAANAGHEYPCIRKADGQFELLRDKHGFVIGGMEDVDYTDYELILEPGSKLFLYTDGVAEATDEEDQLFGEERMLEALNEDPEASPEQLLRNVRSAVDGFVKGAEQFDDITMLCIEYKGPRETGRS